MQPLIVAVPKGRILLELADLLQRAGLDTTCLLRDDRTLIRDDAIHGLRYLLLKPDDVPTYVEFGAADLGVVGRDVLAEREYDVYAPLDLGIGACRLVVAAADPTALSDADPGRVWRIATKFPNIAARHFVQRGQQAETIFVQGSVELGPLTGLADAIVDLVASGETLRKNGLREIETICDVSSVVIANRVGLKLKQERIRPLLERLRQAVSTQPL